MDGLDQHVAVGPDRVAVGGVVATEAARLEGAQPAGVQDGGRKAVAAAQYHDVLHGDATVQQVAHGLGRLAHQAFLVLVDAE